MIKRHITRAVLGTLFCTIPLSGALAAPDAIYINGKIYTADAHDRIVEGFAVEHDRFVATGTSAQMRRLAGKKTRVVDLHGRFVSPGLADDHFHSEGGGAGIDLSHARSLKDVLTIVANAAAAAPSGSLIVSNSDWHEAQLAEQRLPTAQELDEASPDNPVVLVRGGHSYILSGNALREYNITPQTSVPAGGAISRDPSGALTGELFDSAKALVPLPQPKPLDIKDILHTQQVLNSYGITAARITGAYKGDLLTAYRLFQEANRSGQLSVRYIVYLPGFELASVDALHQMLDQWQVMQDEGDNFLRIGGVKLMVDGGFEGGHLSKPYQEPYGKGGAYSGVTIVTPQQHAAVVAELNRLGWRPTTHAVGDAAIEQVLDAYEAANAVNPIAGKRWSIEHAFVSRPDLVERVRKLNIALSVQDHLYLAAPVLKRYWGEPTANEVTPLKTYLDAGILVAGGTDSPTIPVNPFWELYHFMSRDTISDGVYGADQKIASRALLLRLVTINYAKLIGEDQNKGSIEQGKLADFAVLSEDFMTAPPERIRDMKALETYVAGKRVYVATEVK